MEENKTKTINNLKRSSYVKKIESFYINAFFKKSAECL